MKPTAIIAALLFASSALGQSEQWLQYHTSAEPRAYHQLDVTTNPPPGVALPKLNGKAYFARWLTPMDPKGGRWVCFDHVRKSGPCDRLFIDTKGDGRLDDETPVQARMDSSSTALFPATAVTFKGEDGPITYHVIFRLYQFDNRSTQLLVASAGWYEGQVNFDGVKKRLQVFDGNVNGTFNDWDPDPYNSDRLSIAGDKVGERFLGKLLEVDGKFFRIEVARDGAYVTVQKADDVTPGKVQVPTNISEFAAFGENGHFVRKPVNGEFTLPLGKYRMVRWMINRKDQRGAAWTLAGYNFPKTANFEVASDCAANLEIGEPVRAVMDVPNRVGRQLTFNLRFQGQQKESIEILREGQRPPGPKLMLADATGNLCYTNTFEFG